MPQWVEPPHPHPIVLPLVVLGAWERVHLPPPLSQLWKGELMGPYLSVILESLLILPRVLRVFQTGMGITGEERGEKSR